MAYVVTDTSLPISLDVQISVSKLAAILRIADGLDRTHSGKILDVKIKSIGKKLQFLITTKKKRDLEIEFWGAERKKYLFEDIFNTTVSFVQKGKQ